MDFQFGIWKCLKSISTIKQIESHTIKQKRLPIVVGLGNRKNIKGQFLYLKFGAVHFLQRLKKQILSGLISMIPKHWKI